MLAFMCTTGAQADDITLDGVTYSLSSGSASPTAAVIKIPSTSASLTIPATISYGGTYKVNIISMTEANSTLTDLTVEGEIASFRNNMSNAFTNLKNLTFKKLVSEVYDVSFFNNQTLESVKFEGGVGVIGQSAFYQCRKLKTIDFGTRLDEIHQSAFYQCEELEEVVFPADDWYVNIDKQAFYYCPKLARVVSPDDNPYFWDFTLGDECFTRSASITVKIPYGRADYFRKYFNSGATFEEYPSPVTFSLPAGKYEAVQTVEITNAWGTDIYYTTDGSDPLAGGKKYTGPITVDTTTVIRAYGVRRSGAARTGNWATSPVVEAKYDFEPEVKPEVDFSINANSTGGRITTWVTTYADEARQQSWTRILLVGNSPTIPTGVNSDDWTLIRKWMGGGTDPATPSSGYKVHYLDMKNAIFVADDRAFYTYDSSTSCKIEREEIVPDMAFADCMNLDTLLLPSRTEAIGRWVFHNTRSTLVVYAPWTEPIADLAEECFGPDDAHVRGMTIIVPRGSLAAYRKAAHWKAFGNIKEEPMAADEEMVTVVCSDASAAVQAWMNGETQMGTVDAETGELTFVMQKTGSLQLRVPMAYSVSKIFVNNVDETANFTVTEGSDMTVYTHAALTQTSNMVFIIFGDDKLTAALVPSNGQYLLFTDGAISDFGNESRVCQFAKGSDVVIKPYNMNESIFDVHLYINGADRTADLVDGENEKELHLANVTENLLVEAKYEMNKIDMPLFSTKGGTTSVSFTSTDGETYSMTATADQMSRIYDIKTGTPLTFTFRPQEGYELGLVLCDNERSIYQGEGESSDFEVQLQPDGSYRFVLPAEEFNKSIPTITVFYKKTGEDTNYDVTGDGKVTTADVTKLVNIILGRE